MLSLSIYRNLFVFSFVLLFATACQAKEKIEIETPSGQREVFFVDAAITPEEQQKGLMFVRDLPENEGMLFVYKQQHNSRFWMKNTVIPLDMLFFDSSNVLVHIEHSARPYDLTPRGPNTPVCSILELNGGTADKLGIKKGAKLFTNLTQECLQSHGD